MHFHLKVHCYWLYFRVYRPQTHFGAYMTAEALKLRTEDTFETNIQADAQASAVAAFKKARAVALPFHHWLFEDAIPKALCHEIITLPIEAARIEETYGKRDSHNDSRRFFDPALQQKRHVVHEVATLFQSKPVVRSLESLCGVSFKGSYLRIEYCQDREGFWLEPHMDIKEKIITMQIYLNTASDAATLGTDLYDNDKKPFSTAPSTLGQGMIFIPKEPNSWHGFEKRPIKDVRRSLIINYVTGDWRSRHELSFPEQPIS